MRNRKHIYIVVMTFLFAVMTAKLSAQTGEPWTAKELIEPATLANLILSPDGEKPTIFNIGPLEEIRGAVHIGSTSRKNNLDKLSKALETVPRDKMVVIYCGCCPFRNCPNIRPAFSLLKQKGFKNPRLLDLNQNLKVNWTDYGYPMD